MAKEIILYSGIYDFTAEEVIRQMEENKNQDIVLRLLSPGGSVFAGWGIIAKMQERTKAGYKTTVKLDGAAMSMGTMILLFADEVEALDVSTIMIHRASMYRVENDQDRQLLAQVNKDLLKKLEAKINSDVLKELKGVTLKELFDAEERIDLFLTSAEAKKIGLVDKITKLSPKEVEAYNERYFNIAASAENTNTQKTKTMTIEQLKKENPAVFAEAVQIGVEQERDRVGAAMTFIDVDPVAVKDIIKNNKPMTQTLMAEFALKSVSGKKLEQIAAEGAVTNLSTDEVEKEKTEKAKQVDAFEAEVYANLGLKK